MAMMISWIAPVHPSHPYLENDPAPSVAPPTICVFHLGFGLVPGPVPQLPAGDQRKGLVPSDGGPFGGPARAAESTDGNGSPVLHHLGTFLLDWTAASTMAPVGRRF